VKKILNRPADFVDEMLEGLLAAHPDALRSVSPDNRALVRADAPLAGRVGIVTGGGSGHLPVFLGYVGPGLCSGVAVGNVFSSPGMDQVLAATRASSTCTATTGATSSTSTWLPRWPGWRASRPPPCS